MPLNCSQGWNGSCDLTYQKELARSLCIQYDPDIVGIGVTIAFVASSLIAFLSVIIGYFSLSVPDYLLNDVDVLLIRLGRRLLRKGKAIETVEDASDHLRSEGLQSFMLAMSDQQLVSGVALLVAGFARHASITTYSMDVIGALAFLASDVHLSTLPLVRYRLRHHIWSLATRGLFMIATFVMLAFIMVIQTGGHWWDDMFFACGLSHYTLRGTSSTDVVQKFAIVLFLFWGYLDAAFTLLGSGNLSGIVEYVMERFRRRWRIDCVPSRLDYYQARAAQHAKFPTTRNRVRAIIRDIQLMESLAFHEISGSFAFSLIWIVFTQIYGVVYVFQTRNEPSGCSGKMNEAGFGQIVPLVLLVLPLMAAIEAHDDYKDKKVRQEHDGNDNPISDEGNETTSIVPGPSLFSSPAILPSAAEALPDGASMNDTVESLELSTIDLLPPNRSLRSRRTFTGDVDDPQSPTRQDTEARIDLPGPYRAPVTVATNDWLIRWTQKAADPYRWLGVQIMICAQFFLSLSLIIVFAVTNLGLLPPYTYWLFSAFVMAMLVRAILGRLRLLYSAKASKGLGRRAVQVARRNSQTSRRIARPPPAHPLSRA